MTAYNGVKWSGWKPAYKWLSHVYGYIYVTVHALIKSIKIILFSNNQLQNKKFLVIHTGNMVYGQFTYPEIHKT